MPRNRRNYYRILHVQPEAPLEIIKASYRALMGPLGRHPDKGGDHETALLINEAYAVLSDTTKRAAYDRTLARGQGRGAPAPAARPDAAGSGPDPASWRADRCCPFCRRALPDVLRVATRCARCAAPLAPLPTPAPRRKELLGARASARIAKNHDAMLICAPGAAATPVRMRDLSLTGASMYTTAPVPVRQAVRIVDGDIEAVAVVVACRRRDALYIVHAQLLTIRVERRTGVFVSEHA